MATRSCSGKPDGTSLPNQGKVGLTIIELVVVLSILLMLSAIILPYVRMARSVAEKTQCALKMRQIGVAFAIYTQDNAGSLPPRYVSAVDMPPGWTGGVGFWYNPFIRYSMTDGLDNLGKVSSLFRCQADRRTNTTSVNIGYSSQIGMDIWSPWGKWSDNRRMAMISKPSITAMCTDTAGDCRWQAGPPLIGGPENSAIGWNPGQLAPCNYITRHLDGANVLYVDSHVGYSKNPTYDLLQGVLKVTR